MRQIYREAAFDIEDKETRLTIVEFTCKTLIIKVNLFLQQMLKPKAAGKKFHSRNKLFGKKRFFKRRQLLNKNNFSTPAATGACFSPIPEGP